MLMDFYEGLLLQYRHSLGGLTALLAEERSKYGCAMVMEYLKLRFVQLNAKEINRFNHVCLSV